MASLSRGISFRRQGSSGMSWTDTWSFNEEGVLVRTMKEEVEVQPQPQRFAGCSLSRIHDSQADDDDDDDDETTSSPPFPTCPPSSHSPALCRSKSLGTNSNPLFHSNPLSPSSKFFKWLKKSLLKLKK